MISTGTNIAFDDPQLSRPVRQSEAQALKIGMPGHDQRFYFRDLAVAADDSCSDLHTLGFYLLERPAITIERCFEAREPLPPLDDHIDILRIELQSTAHALSQFRRGQRGTAAKERLVHQFALLGVIQNRAPHQFDRLLCGVVEFVLLRATHDELGRGTPPDRGVFAGFPKPGSFLFSDIPAWLVLPMIIPTREHEVLLNPNNLRPDLKSCGNQAVLDNARMKGSVPDI